MECDRAGDWRADIIEFGLKEFESGAVALNIRCRLGELYDHDNKVWDEWAEHGMEAFGSLFLVKKDGSLNQEQIKAVCEATGWNGDFAAITDGTWQPMRCQVQTKRNEYEGNVSYRVNWISPHDREPGSGLSNVDSVKAKSLNARFGGSIRALAGNAARNVPKTSPNGPPAPRPAIRPIPRDANEALAEAAAEAEAGNAMDCPF